MRRIIVAALWLAARAGPLQWEAASGQWSGGPEAGTGRSAGIQPATLLSTEWYNDFEFTGEIDGMKRSSGLISILARYAGPTESYALVVDPARARIFIRENHYAESREAASTAVPVLASESQLRFRITGKGKLLTASVWPAGADPAAAVTMQFGDVQVPEGRAGLAVESGEIRYSQLQLKGDTRSQFATYAFHCDYKLPDKAAAEPLWQYLDAVGSSLASRYPRQFKSADDFDRYRKQTVLKLRNSLGLDPWPERSPLRARTAGILDRGDFKIEKIVFESQPGFLVDALLYLPKKAAFPVPGVLSTIGHYGDDSFFIWSEQARCIGLARKGYAVLTYDPISQGERKWLGNGNHDTLRRKIILSGMEVSGLMFWDSIRAIDYLISRPEVDANRIGVTGVSGGGFNTLYTAILDERVKVAAPDGYATSTEALIKRASAGCCSYLPNMNRYADIPEMYSLIAPRKLMILGGYMDILSDRLLDVYDVARRAYQVFGAPESITYYLDPNAGHTYSKPMRLAMYWWFNKWLKGVDDPAEAAEPKDPEDNLTSRDSGLLRVLAPGERGKDVIDLEREYLARHRTQFKMPVDREGVAAFQAGLREKLIALMGDIPLAKSPVIASDDKASGRGSTRHVVLKTERDLPMAIDIPTAANGSTSLIVYFSMEDRYPSADIGKAEMIARLVREGFTVAAPEVRGTGATRVRDMNSVALFSMALGKHLFSSRICDLQRALDFLRSQPEYANANLVVWGEGLREGMMALYLAAIDPRVSTVVSSHGLLNYQHIVDKDGLPDFDYYVPGVLKYADAAEITSAIAPRRVLISAPVFVDNTLAGHAAVLDAYGWAEQIYKASGVPARIAFPSQLDLIGEVKKQAGL